MVTIRSMMLVQAPIERCFKLAISIDLMMEATGQKAIAGVTSGLIGPGDTVTWQGGSFGKKSSYRSLVEVWRPYSYFRDIMVTGPFRSYEHEHHFAPMNDGTRIRDEIRFTASTGVLGRLSEKFILRKKMAKMLKQRNALIKKVAESDEWHKFLDGRSELDMRVFQASSATPHNTDSVYAD
jgi:ligand-binding SRPBCC domain-containing protein